jgi:hypothetical protein
VLDADPLVDIHNSASVHYTMLNGRLYDANTMNELMPREKPRTKFYWEKPAPIDTGWNESWSGQ